MGGARDDQQPTGRLLRFAPPSPADLSRILNRPKKPQAYAAPAWLLQDPPALLDFMLKLCCCGGGEIRALAAALEVSRQSLWLWRKPGYGLPRDPALLERIERALADPGLPLRLPSNATLEDLVRPERPKADPGEGHAALLDFLDRITASADPRFGRPCLRRLLDAMNASAPSPLPGPIVFYRWGYGFGVPKPQIRRFAEAAAALELNELYDLRPAAFRKFLGKAMADRHRSGADPD